MARPIKNNAEFFPHYTSMRNHRKIKMLRNKFGSVLGYAFWAMFIEFLTEQDGLEWDYSEIEIEMFASELGVSAAEIPPLVDFCLRIELLFKSDDGFIYSESLNEALKPVFEKRERERQKSQSRQRKNGKFRDYTMTHGVSAAETPPQCVVSAEVSPQSRVEYSKVYIKEKEKEKSETSKTRDKPRDISFSEKLDYFIKIFNETKGSKENPTRYKHNDKIKKSFKARLSEGYKSSDFIKAIENCKSDPYHQETKLKYLTPEFILRADKLEMYLNAQPESAVKSIPLSKSEKRRLGLLPQRD